MTILLQRLCWNSNGWRGPTGEGYQKESSYVGEHGFGHEEWNLNTADTIGDKVYGYTYYNPSPHNRISLGPHDIYFFAIAPSKDRLLVGAYRDAFFLSNEERQQLKKRLEGSDYLERRAKELVALRLPHLSAYQDAQRALLQDFALNVCTVPEKVIVFSPPRILTESATGGRNPKRLNRYTHPVFLSGAPVSESDFQLSVIAQSTPNQRLLLEDAYVRFSAEQQQVILRRHNLLSNRFQAWLSKIGAASISVETDSVDVSCVHTGQSLLFELKTCYTVSPRHALREALGQILEYAFYPTRTNHDHLAIVLDAEPSSTDIQWFRRMHGKGITVEVFWLIGERVYSARVADHPLTSYT